MKDLLIREEYIRLCDAVKLAGEAETGGMAKMMITSGQAKVNGEICLQKGKKLYPGDCFSLEHAEYRIIQ